ncbi:MAG: DUF1559 domain-containing protein [Planctomycetaceae bacterium]
MKHCQNRHSRGFTVIELLTVASCLSVLSALILPAIQDARSAALRTKCQNNLKSVALAMHNYHDVYNGFPPGWISRYRDAESEGGFGWQARLLPYVEQAPLYSKLEMNHPMTEPEGLLTESVNVYLCPADTDAPKTNPYRGGYGTSSYSGSLGTIAPNRWIDGRVEAYWPGAVTTYAALLRQGRPGKKTEEDKQLPGPASLPEAMLGSPDGIFGWNISVRMRDISDGSSNTLMAGERSRMSGWGIWPGTGSNRFETDVVTDVSFQSPLNQSLTGFSSAHPGGLFVALCDGSVRFLSDEVDSRPEGGVLQFLGTRNGNEVITGNPFPQ